MTSPAERPQSQPDASSTSATFAISAIEPQFAMPLQRGDVVGGKYRIESLIGVGGVGFVVSATHVDLDEPVALKFLRPEFVRHEEAVSRFMLEARASVRIKSDHVVRVLDVGTLADGAPFMVMELLEGIDLGRLLETAGPLSVECAVEYVLQVCAALATAHASQIVHRDVKPANLFLTRTTQGVARVKVLDFGISKVALTARPLDRSRQALTVSPVGSPPYMSPEQVRSRKDIDARTDIWSLGCVLYELLSGAGPFDRISLMQACAAVLEEEPKPLCIDRSDVPPQLEAVIMRCLRKEPSERFTDIAALAEALAAFSPSGSQWAEQCRGILASAETQPPSLPAGAEVAAPAPAAIGEREPGADAARSPRRIRAIGSLLGASLLVVAGALWATTASAPDSVPAHPKPAHAPRLATAQHPRVAGVTQPPALAPDVEAQVAADPAPRTATSELGVPANARATNRRAPATAKPRAARAATAKPVVEEPDVGF